MNKKSVLPPSREVRLQDGVTHGYLEDFLFQAHTAPTSELIPLIAKAELEVQNERSRAVHELGALLARQMTENHSSIGMLDVEDAIRLWHEDEVLGVEHARLSDES